MLFRWITLLVLLTALRVGSPANVLALFGFPGRSHWTMVEPLLKALATRGHNVTVLSYFPLQEPLENYHHLSLQGANKLVADFFTIDIARNIGPMGSFVFMMSTTTEFCDANMVHPSVKKVLQARDKYDVVITEVFGNDCFAAFSNYFDAPLIGVSTSLLFPWMTARMGNPHNPAVSPIPLLSYTVNMNFYQRVVNTLCHVACRLSFDWYCTPNNDQLIKTYLGDNFPSTNDIIRNTSLLLVNSHPSIHPPQPFLPNIIEVAGLHILAQVKKLPKEIEDILNGASDHGAVLFTFGSVVKADETSSKSRMEAFVNAFSRIPNRVLWRANATRLQEKGFKIPPNVFTSTWLPQYDILNHPNVRAFISHGGMGGVLEAAQSGVPILGMPLFAEQGFNVENHVRLGAALRLDFDDLTADSLVEAISKLTEPGSSFSKKAAELSRRFRDRPLSPLDAAIFWTEYVIRHRGAFHLRSAALNLSWFQRSLLDIVAFVAVVLVACVACFCWCMRRKSSSLNDRKKAKKKSN